MKKIQKYFNILLFLIVVHIFKISTISAATNPYAQTGPYGKNCTWYAWKMANEKAGVTLPGWGNAKDWYSDARNAGYTVGTTPQANSIIVWGGWTTYGHVGYVESINGNIMYVWDSTGPCIDENDAEFRECIANGVSEETDKICYANAKRIACEYTISPDNYGVTGYIYLNYAPTTPVISQNTMSQENESTNVEVIKSNNNNLSNIVISSGTLEFDKEIFEYNIEVDNEINIITVNATAEDSTATITGIGDYELNTGINEVKLIVTAEDGSTKEYVIQVTRNEKKEVELDSDKNDKKTEGIIKKKNQQTTILALSIFALTILVVCVILILKRKKHNKNQK